MDEKRLLTVWELAKALGMSRAAVYRFRREGMPYIKLGPKMVKYDLEDVVTWMKARGQGK
ncbi:MAG: helix-turn-helix transcriptional regulator [Symbiobacteriia bacterium]